ncbi:hypothetical protein WG901_20910 [Novosphingobium sp. PS1R-30]|uniref:Uncharacterized protein n=1 Tax=Novosphingobium anseongense TaxID=3133436 RepID=A0ABU8S1A3_9SPHN
MAKARLTKQGALVPTRLSFGLLLTGLAATGGAAWANPTADADIAAPLRAAQAAKPAAPAESQFRNLFDTWQRAEIREKPPVARVGPDCSVYLGQVLALDSFATIAAKLRTIPTLKGEYETTAAFEARAAAARAGAPGKVIIRGMLDPEYLTYDADNGALKVQAYALSNYVANYSGVFGYGQPLYGKVDYGGLGNRDVVVADHEVPVGSYIGSNAFGAKVRVTRSTRLTQAIFEGKPAVYDEKLFVGQHKGTDAFIGAVPMTIAEARALKFSGKVAFVAEPKWPFFAEGIHYGNPRFDNPNDVTNPTQVIIADIQCGLLLTGANRVVGAFATY